MRGVGKDAETGQATSGAKTLTLTLSQRERGSAAEASRMASQSYPHCSAALPPRRGIDRQNATSPRATRSPWGQPEVRAVGRAPPDGTEIIFCRAKPEHGAWPSRRTAPAPGSSSDPSESTRPSPRLCGEERRCAERIAKTELSFSNVPLQCFNPPRFRTKLTPRAPNPGSYSSHQSLLAAPRHRSHSPNHGNRSLR